jgi:hypothetical protein
MLSEKIDAFRESCNKQQIPYKNVADTTEEGII